MSKFRETAMKSLSGDRHDHGICVADALQRAEAVCAARGVRLTKLRRHVLELIWESGHAPIGAYDLLRRLDKEHAAAVPTTVYRALDFLLEQGLVHRIESLNAFVGCASPQEEHVGQFLICRNCGTAAEMNDARIDRAIDKVATELGFSADGRVVEVRGLCPSCRSAEA